MKKLLSVILILCLVFASAVPAFAADASGTTVELVKTTGKVTITTAAGKTVDFKSDKATKLVDGYTVKTGAASYAYISLDQTQAIKMDASTTVTIDKKGKKLDVNLVSGKLIYDVKEPLKKDQSTTVSTSNSITGIRGTFGLVRTFFDLNLGRQVSATTLFEGHSKVSTLGESGNIVSSIMVSAGNILESIGNMAKSSQLTKDDFAGFMAVELAEDPALLARVEKALAESDNPEAANINVREIAANAETILAADEKQAEEEAKALEAELAAQKVEQEKAEAAAKTDKLDGQEDVVQLFDGETAATDPAADAVSAESAETPAGDTGSSGGSSSGSTTTSEYNPTDATSLADAFTQANLDAASGKASVINAPTSGDFSNQSYDVGQNVTINSNNNFNPGTLNLNGGKLTGNMNSSGSTINVNGTGSEISGNITAGTLNVNGGGELNVATGSTFNATSVNVASGGSMTNAGNFTATDLTVNGNMTNTKNVTASNSMTVDGGTYTTTATGATTTISKNLTVNNNGTYTGNPTISGSGNTLELGTGAGAAQDNATINGNVILANDATLNMNSGSVTNGVTINGCTVNANGGTITGGIVGNVPTSGSVDAKVVVSGGTVKGGITGHFVNNSTTPGVKVVSGNVEGGITLEEGNVVVSGGTITGGITGECSSVEMSNGTVKGGIDLTYGNLTVTGGTIKDGRYGINSPNSFTVSGGTISGTECGIHHDGGGASITISGGDITGATGVYLRSNTSGLSSVYITGGTIKGTTGDGLFVAGGDNGCAFVDIGSAGASGTPEGTATIISLSGNGITNENTIFVDNISLYSCTIEATASGKYALNGGKFDYQGVGDSVKVKTTGRAQIASNADITATRNSQDTSNHIYNITSTDGTGSNAGLSFTYPSADSSTLQEVINRAEAGDVIQISGNGDITEEVTLPTGVTLASEANFKPAKLTLAGGTLTGILNNTTTIIETSSDSDTTSTIEAGPNSNISPNRIIANANTTLVLATGSSISCPVYATGGTVKNYTRLDNSVTITTSGEFYNYGSILLSGKDLSLDGSSSKLYNESAGIVTIDGSDSSNPGHLNLYNGSRIEGKISMTGESAATITGGSSIINNTTDATLTASGNATVSVDGGTIKNTSTSGGYALSLEDDTITTISGSSYITSTKGTAIDFGGTGMTISNGNISGAVGINANKASGSGGIVLNGGNVTGTEGNGITIGTNVTVSLGDLVSVQPSEFTGSAIVTGAANGIEITSTNNGFCYLISGSVESKSSADFALKGTYGDTAPGLTQPGDRPSRFYFGDHDGQNPVFDNAAVRLKSAAVPSGASTDLTDPTSLDPNLNHLVYGQPGNGDAHYEEDGESGWYFLKHEN